MVVHGGRVAPVSEDSVSGGGGPAPIPPGLMGLAWCDGDRRAPCRSGRTPDTEERDVRPGPAAEH